MKAYLINPEEMTIKEVEHDDSLNDIYQHINADCIDAVRINKEGDTIYIDDEGLYRQDHFFGITGNMHPIAGSGLVLGADREGYSIAPSISLEELEGMVNWVSAIEAVAMAEAAEAIIRDQQKLHPNVEHIVISGADILKDREYTDPSE